MSHPPLILVDEGCTVTVHYALRDPDGGLVRTTRGREPVSCVHGRNQLPPGIERALTGLGRGDRLDVLLAPADAYGERKGPGPQRLHRRELRGVDLHEGKLLEVRRPGAEPVRVWVVRVAGVHVWVDTDHPLAGRTLRAEVEIVDACT